MADRPLNGVQTDATPSPAIRHDLLMSAERPVRILTSDMSLAEQLRARLELLLGCGVTILQGIGETAPQEIVVTTTTECSPDECAGLTQSGVAVVVLAALPSNYQERSYREAGAADYLAMSLDMGPLAGALQSLA